MFDLKDIIDLLPFITDNPAKSIYMIVVSIAIGFMFGKIFAGFKMKSKKQLEDENDKLLDENKQLKSELVLTRGSSTLPFTTLANLDKLMNSDKGDVELSAIIEFSIKNNSTKKPE